MAFIKYYMIRSIGDRMVMTESKRPAKSACDPGDRLCPSSSPLRPRTHSRDGGGEAGSDARLHQYVSCRKSVERASSLLPREELVPIGLKRAEVPRPGAPRRGAFLLERRRTTGSSRQNRAHSNGF